MKIAPILVLFISGCASDPFVSPVASTIEFIGAPDASGYGGLFAVDGRQAPGGVVQIAPGSRKLKYGCPGYIYTDMEPTVEVTIAPSSSYEMLCTDGKVIVRAK